MLAILANEKYYLQLFCDFPDFFIPDCDTAYTTQFIGKNGTVLKEEFGLETTYAFKGDEQYVRAKVFSSGGELAFCQPVFIKK